MDGTTAAQRSPSESSRGLVLRSQLVALLSRSTVHGISHSASSSNRYEQLFWLTLVVLGVTSFIGNLVSVVQRYNQFPVLTAYYSNEENFTWPDITFCDNSPITLDNDTAFELFLNLTNQLSADRRVQNLSSLMDKLHNNSLGIEALNVLVRSITLSTIDSHVFQADDALRVISRMAFCMQKESIQTEINMDSMCELFDDYAPYFHSNSISLRYRCACYTLKLNDFIFEKKFNAIDSLQFYLKGNHLTYVRFNSSNYQFGGRVYIHLPNTLPEDGHMIETPPGVTTTVLLEQKRHRLIPKKSDCRETEKTAYIYDFDLMHARPYNLSYFHCHQMLSQRLFYERCRCFNPHLIVPKLDNQPPVLCFNLSVYNQEKLAENLRCLDQTATHYRDELNFRSLLRSECADLRRKRCDSLTWELGKQREMYREMWAETANPARMAFIRAALQDIAPTKATDSMDMATVLRHIRLEISNLILVAAKDKGDLVVEEPEFPASQLLSDIGGLMGLYLGVSVIGLCEFMAVLVLLAKFGALTWCPSRSENARPKRNGQPVGCRRAGDEPDFSYKCPSRRPIAKQQQQQQQQFEPTEPSLLSITRSKTLYSSDDFFTDGVAVPMTPDIGVNSSS